MSDVHSTGALRQQPEAVDHDRALLLEISALLWDMHPECCGNPCVGAQYMGQNEMICCGQPQYDLLTDAQIVSSLRSLLPEPQETASGSHQEARSNEQGEST